MTRNLLHREMTAVLARRPAAGRRVTRRLGTDEVDLWRVSLDGHDDDALRSLRALLSPDEEERAQRFYFERDRRRFIAGRGLLRQVLSRYVGEAPETLEFTYGPNGKPALAGLATAPCFNVAHSEALAVFAITGGTEVGVDVEHLRDLLDWESIADAYFSAVEHERLKSVPAALRPVEFFRAWTRQEAVLKATGAGLGALDDGTLDFYADPTAGGENPAFRTTTAPRLRICPFAPAEGYVAALAVEPTVRWVTCFSGRGANLGAKSRHLRHSRRRLIEQMAKTGVEFL